MAKPLKPTARMSAAIAVPELLVKPTTRRNVASNPNPEMRGQTLNMVYMVQIVPIEPPL